MKNRKKRHKSRNPIAKALRSTRKKIFAMSRDYSRKRRKAADRDTKAWHKNP